MSVIKYDILVRLQPNIVYRLPENEQNSQKRKHEDSESTPVSSLVTLPLSPSEISNVPEPTSQMPFDVDVPSKIMDRFYFASLNFTTNCYYCELCNEDISQPLPDFNSTFEIFLKHCNDLGHKEREIEIFDYPIDNLAPVDKVDNKVEDNEVIDLTSDDETSTDDTSVVIDSKEVAPKLLEIPLNSLAALKLALMQKIKEELNDYVDIQISEHLVQVDNQVKSMITHRLLCRVCRCKFDLKNDTSLDLRQLVHDHLIGERHNKECLASEHENHDYGADKWVEVGGIYPSILETNGPGYHEKFPIPAHLDLDTEVKAAQIVVRLNLDLYNTQMRDKNFLVNHLGTAVSYNGIVRGLFEFEKRVFEVIRNKLHHKRVAFMLDEFNDDKFGKFLSLIAVTFEPKLDFEHLSIVHIDSQFDRDEGQFVIDFVSDILDQIWPLGVPIDQAISLIPGFNLPQNAFKNIYKDTFDALKGAVEKLHETVPRGRKYIHINEIELNEIFIYKKLVTALENFAEFGPRDVFNLKKIPKLPSPLDFYLNVFRQCSASKEDPPMRPRLICAYIFGQNNVSHYMRTMKWYYQKRRLSDFDPDY